MLFSHPSKFFHFLSYPSFRHRSLCHESSLYNLLMNRSINCNPKQLFRKKKQGQVVKEIEQIDLSLDIHVPIVSN